MTQTSHHLDDFNGWNLILPRVVKFCLLKGALVSWNFKKLFASHILPTSYTSLKRAALRKHSSIKIFEENDWLDGCLSQNAVQSVFCSYTFLIQFGRNNIDQGQPLSSLFHKKRLFRYSACIFLIWRDHIFIRN